MHYIARVTTADPEPGSSSPLLAELARRVRTLRRERSWSRSDLAGRSGLSVRFLARIEAGEGNVSVLRLDALARALGTTPDRLLSTPAQAAVIALVGLRGAGKSTVGPLLARRLGRPFVELDERITEDSGLTLDQLFDLHGESYYRRLEQDVLRRILDEDRPLVLAAAGGIVTEHATWEMLCRRASVVWLRARPEDHWSRVVAQGDRRPMADHPRAMEELRSLLAARERAYSEAGLVVDTTGVAPEDVAATVAAALGRAG
jgi:XRE family aerobic/anaerobic benzoate catabolism transcriptional regulator